LIADEKTADELLVGAAGQRLPPRFA